MIRRIVFALMVSMLTLPAAASQVQRCQHRHVPPLAVQDGLPAQG